VLSGVVSKTAAYGFLGSRSQVPGPTHDLRTPILILAAVGLVYGSRSHSVHRTSGASSRTRPSRR
jgi:NADH:ubiquinone oxidoreductase subunit 4 (subunit M)